MRTNAAALSLIRKFEGLELRPYKDSAGVLTIGVGHAIRRNEPDLLGGITQDEAERLLRDDLKAAERAVERWTDVALNENQFGALASFVFNVGGAAYRDSTLRRLLNQGRLPAAADEFPRWCHAGGRTVGGLVLRRQAERSLFLRPVPAAPRDAH